ncbi:helix-turn-helix domain-containing GNAT family N-acetyltransferase [Nocardiopsis changdeensis]|uniref:Metalloregulator ArsR/SmtB family transcription factor n=1 Tax=Nocardiopsis changdeensis TaxID=2831969 RepID=A0ABX8BSR6_9ACTN|nr:MULTISPECIES: metalloregulator ArsR/SmtB family transcription factor [Nocardiopsis]QUX25134.1 metalloregulator ArsR/SmtB family transcription factor [Nocardiopsis changdeensis]QYX35521.1 metalloregulator ArsR/SmtB family transcription factor [Nocardiopsis sp. MT53]
MTVTTPDSLSALDAETYAAWFACLAEPMRVRLLHAIATTPGSVGVGELAEMVDLRQPTVSHHLRKLADVGFVTLTRVGTSTRVAVNPACCVGLPHAADAVMGLLAARPCCPTDLPGDVATRPMADADLERVREIYAEGIATGDATFETEAPPVDALKDKWLPGHRWVAELDGAVVGWAAAAPVSAREAYTGVAETSVYVAGAARGRGVGKALLYRQVTEADTGGLWTLQTSVFPENRASLALHHQAGFRTVGVRERIARHHGRWRDTVLLERRRETGAESPACAC